MVITMYGIKELIENYTKKELTDGGVLALSEEVRLTEKEVVLQSQKVRELHADFEADEQRRTGRVAVRVILDEAHGELVSAECNCSQFSEDGYGCVHIVAAQTVWLLRRKDPEAFQESPLREMLTEKTGLADPFIPGIMRRTSGSLMKLLDSAERNRAAAERESGKRILAPGSLKIQMYFAFPEDKLFELKVGTGKMYVVKDAMEFMKGFYCHDLLEFGKNFSFTAYEELLDSDSREILRLLTEIYELHVRERQNVYFCRGTSGGGARYIQVNGRYFDALMELMEGKRFYGGDGRSLTFSGQEYRPELSVEKMTCGAFFRMEAVSEFTQTGSWIYLENAGVIYRIAQKRAGRLAEFMDLFAKQGELFVSEQDLAQVCREVVTDFAESLQVQTIGMSMEEYLPEKPKIRLYVDHPQNDMISCMPQACYGEKAYALGMEFEREQSRDIRYERDIRNRLLPFFQAYDEKIKSYFFQGADENLYYFLTEVFPVLEEMGELFVSDRLKKLKVRPASCISVGVSVAGGLLQMDIRSDEFDNKELMEVLSAYDRKKRYYRLKNGSFLKVEDDQAAVLGALSECLRGVRKPADGEWKIPLFRAWYLDEMLKEKSSVSMEKSREYRRLLGRMREALNSAYEPPESLKDIMREYQKDGFRWIKMLKENGFGGILADDMGLGKTLQILSFLLSEKEAGKKGEEIRTLIITPASLVYNWKKEMERYTPSLKVAMIAGTAQERQNMIQNPAEDADVWITSYDLLKRDIPYYENVIFANEILDEAQFVKNQTTHAAKSVRLVQSGFRMALTGTPIENRLSELWSIFDYLMPGFLYPYARFREEIELPVVASQDEDVMKRLRCMIHPFILRRMKRDVLKELPDKLEEEILISLEGEQRRVYDAYEQRLRMYLEGQSEEEFAQGKLEILAEITKLRQLCCHPGMILEDYDAPDAKLEACVEILHQAVEGGHKILLFSQFTTMLDAIGKRLKEEGIAYHRIDGSVKKEERIRLVEAFDKDDVPVFCISLKAGGTGLNLTAADIVIHFDPWWNLAAQNQATDRAHRIGQENVVTVYQLIAADTIEERIVSLQKSKARLAEDVLSGEGVASILIDRQQVLALLDGRA